MKSWKKSSIWFGLLILGATILQAQITVSSDTTYSGGVGEPGLQSAVTGYTISGNGTDLVITGTATVGTSFLATGGTLKGITQSQSSTLVMNSATATITANDQGGNASVIGLEVGNSANATFSAGTINATEAGAGTAYVFQRAGSGNLTVSGGIINLSTAGSGAYGFLNLAAGASGTTTISGGQWNLTNGSSTGVNQGFNIAGGKLNFVGSAFTLTDTSGATTYFDQLTQNTSTSINAGTYKLNATLNDTNTLNNINLTIGGGSTAISLSGNTVSFVFSAIPEPTTNALIGFGFLTIALFLKRKGNKQSINV